MTGFSTPAILLRRISYGDVDLIVTFFTLASGKVTVMAKAAKKSTKRFAGILEPFSVMDIVCGTGQSKGMPILKEAALREPFPAIRTDMVKTGYASYWTETTGSWMEDRQPQPDAYHLLRFSLDALDRGISPGEDLSILFQMRFLSLAGLGPNLKGCCICKSSVEGSGRPNMGFDLSRGGLVCGRCMADGANHRLMLAAGTVKQLRWIQAKDLDAALRVRFERRSRQEALRFLETFVPYHLGRAPKSLRVLQQVRGEGWVA